MGAKIFGEELAIQKSSEIPKECKRYISHHVRNGLVSIMGAAMRLKDEPGALDDLECCIKHIAVDLEKVGL
ncbi:MAG TPA: hypothetical protein DDW94_04045 [Deltaproteobacteria bacterium]|nr:MAG: hypothetical protein A2Z79_10735 [Deltaproteobacteria bacterium GWA2_55_82]OGQ62901.1 MAG: hypothetical protein A3I81_06235 [Deltaproteobacteria bacterium RIFCSPLOWO2_02_FULL_55_12]OIJ72862.1 MAG: hypothetical protein A2V21_300470 [Deltaproteobacteria bacterium GWC2_55_46]HBG46143.1 hypothetical protein [Deltaproteobacteria bacterium]HCY11641.1 hypothetical protein [Deltaproteobacteria bacterium]